MSLMSGDNATPNDVTSPLTAKSLASMVDKYNILPKDIQWHMIGHLQSNKVKYMAHFVDLIHNLETHILPEIG